MFIQVLVILYCNKLILFLLKAKATFSFNLGFCISYLDIFVVLFQLTKMFLIVLDNDTSSD